MLLGVIIILLPFLGFTSKWDTIFSVAIGLVIITIAYKINVIDNGHVLQDQVKKENVEEKIVANLPFVDHRRDVEGDASSSRDSGANN